MSKIKVASFFLGHGVYATGARFEDTLYSCKNQTKELLFKQVY